MENEDNDEPSYLFWREGFEGSCRGGIFMRSMGVGRFVKECEDKGYVMAGVRFDQSNNCEFLFKKPGDGEGNGE